MNAHSFISQLGHVLKLPDLALDDANVCRVVFDGHAVDFEKTPDADVLFFIAEVCPLPTTGGEALFRRLLEGNRFGIETADAILGIDPDMEGVILHRKLDLSGMDYAAFEEALSVYYARLLYWKDVCAKVDTEAASVSVMSSVSPGEGMIRA